MKKFTFLLFAVLLLVSCVSFAETPTPIFTAIPSSTSTLTPVPTSTKSPTATFAIPTETITPMVVAPVSSSPLTLTEFNAGTEMKRLSVIGTGSPHDIKFSPDGKQLAVATGRGVYFYDSTTFEQSSFIDVNASVSAIAFSPDGGVLAMGIDGKVSLWNVASGQNMSSLEGGMISVFKLVYGQGGYVAAMGGDCLGCGSPQLAMTLWNARTGRQIVSEHEIWYSTDALTFTSDGEQLVFGGRGGVTIIESETGKQVATYNSGKGVLSSAIDAPFDFIFSKDETQLFVTSFEESSEVFDVASQAIQPFTLCDAYLIRTNEVGACLKDKKISVFDLSTGEQIQTLTVGIDIGFWRGMFALNQDGRLLAYINDSVLYVVNMQSSEIVKTISFSDFKYALPGIIDINGGEKLVAATSNHSNQVDIFDLESGVVVRVLKLDCCEITGFAFAPDHKTAATIGGDILRLWNISSQQIIYEARLAQSFSGPIVFSPNGLSVFLTSPEGFLFKFNIQTKEIQKHEANQYAFRYVEPFAVDNYHFDKQGEMVTLNYEKQDEKFIPSFTALDTNGKITVPFEAKTDFDFIETFAINSDGKYFAIGNPTDIYIWNIVKAKLQSTLSGHEQRSGDGWLGKIQSLVFNPKSDLLVSVGWDQTTRLWNITTGNELRHLNVCCSASFTPDGRYLVTAGDGVIRVWGIP